jgi:hypothetical protein
MRTTRLMHELEEVVARFARELRLAVEIRPATRSCIGVRAVR